MKAHLKTNITNTSMIVDSQTGEIIEQDVKTFKYLAGTREDFFIAYTSLLGVFEKMTAPEIKVYCYLLTNYQIGALIPITRQMRKYIGEKQGINERTVANTLVLLSDKALIYSIQRGIYKINPRYAFKGSTKDRNSMLKMVLELECPHC